MNRTVRMWIEVALAGVGGVLTVLTLVRPDWIEVFLREESLDHGDGSYERLLAIGWLVGTVVFAALAHRDWRHLARSSA